VIIRSLGDPCPRDALDDVAEPPHLLLHEGDVRQNKESLGIFGLDVPELPLRAPFHQAAQPVAGGADAQAGVRSSARPSSPTSRRPWPEYLHDASEARNARPMLPSAIGGVGRRFPLLAHTQSTPEFDPFSGLMNGF